jgi:hypothetical protein
LVLRVGIYRPVGVPKANHAFKHAFTGVLIYTDSVGINSALSICGGFPRT